MRRVTTCRSQDGDGISPMESSDLAGLPKLDPELVSHVLFWVPPPPPQRGTPIEDLCWLEGTHGHSPSIGRG